MRNFTGSARNCEDAGVTLDQLIPRLVPLFAAIVSIPALVVVSLRVREAMMLFAASDEVEQFVIGRMLCHGRHLYSDVFSHHGPLQYLLTYLYASWISESNFSYIRLSQIFLAAASCGAVVCSPAICTRSGRLWAGELFILLLSSFWSSEGLYAFFSYTMDGFLLTPLVAQYVVPLTFQKEPNRVWSFVSGAAAAAACFSAYTNCIPVLVLMLSPLSCLLTPARHSQLLRYLRPLALGMILTTSVIGVWLLRHGDLEGYFVYHFYFNQAVYKGFSEFTLSDWLMNFSFSFEPETIIHTASLSLLGCSIYILARLQRATRSSSRAIVTVMELALVVLGAILTNPRALPPVGDAGFVTVSLALFALSNGCLLDEHLARRTTGGVVDSALLFAAALFLACRVEGYATSFLGVPNKEVLKYTDTLAADRTAIYRFVRALTKEDGDLLALNYNATVYFKADRIPASGHLFYLPWQAAYNRHPIGEYKLDICADIARRRPAVIWFFNWRVAGKYSLDDYEPCVLALISQHYTPLQFASPWQIRNDLYRDAVGKLPSDADASLYIGPTVAKILDRSPRLTRIAPLQMHLSPTHLERKTSLRRIGVLIGENGHENGAEADLHLEGPGGAETVRRFSLSELEGNKYRYFDIDPNVYTTGEIRSVVGEGLSIWESRMLGDLPYTCMIYEYIDNTRRYTPACPIM